MVVSLLGYNKRCIDATVFMPTSDFHWRLTCFYGEPNLAARPQSWAVFKTLKTRWDGPWVCLGDFNEVLYQVEAVGRSVRQAWQLKAFRDALLHCQLFDLEYSGDSFTWSSSTCASPQSRARLD